VAVDTVLCRFVRRREGASPSDGAIDWDNKNKVVMLGSWHFRAIDLTNNYSVR
jgi:hypothetical protein